MTSTHTIAFEGIKTQKGLSDFFAYKAFVTLALWLLLFSNLHSQPFGNEWIDYNKTYYAFSVAPISPPPSNANNHFDPGDYQALHRISYSTLLASGLAGIPAEHFQLWRNGREVAIYTNPATGPIGPGGFIEFWAQPNDGLPDTAMYRAKNHQQSRRWNMFSDTAKYFLTTNASGTNERYLDVPNPGSTSGVVVPDSFFMHRISINFRASRLLGYAVNVAGKEVRSSTWDAGEGWGDNRSGTAIISVNLKDLKLFAGGDSMRLQFSAAGSGAPNRIIRASINGDSATQKFVSQYNCDSIFSNGLPLTMVKGDSALLRFQRSVSSSSDRFSLAKAELIYPRSYIFGPGTRRFRFTLPAHAQAKLLKIVGFDTADASAILLDLSKQRRYVGERIADTLYFLLPTAAAEYQLALSSLNVGQAPVIEVNNLLQKVFLNVSDTANQGNYLILTHKNIREIYAGTDQAMAYMAHRRSAAGGNFNARVYDIDEITDQFAYGISRNPLAVRNFINYASSQFTQKPKYALLLGRGAMYIQPANNPNQPILNLIPTWGHPASDNLLAASNNSSPEPLIPIGRVAVINGAEVKDYLDKVKAFEGIQQSADSIKTWQKNVQHLVGGSDNSLVSILNNYLNNYKKVIQDTLVGAEVSTYMRNNDPKTAVTQLKIKKQIRNGVSLITYFGHSSASSLDFSLNNPDEIDCLPGRLPVFIANGCNAAEFFDLNASRPGKNQMALSEKFVLEPEKGSIAFLSSTSYGVLSYLDLFTTNWYQALCRTHYGAGLGDLHKRAIAATQLGYADDFYNRLTCEQYHLHGDPAIRLYTAQQPDYVADSTTFSFMPTAPTIASDSLRISFTIGNQGKATSDSVTIKLLQQKPSGLALEVYARKVAPIRARFTCELTVPLLGPLDTGTHIFTIAADPANNMSESIETNNTATRHLHVTGGGMRPIYPANFAIEGLWPPTLYAATNNQTAAATTYRLECDTTMLFNSPLLYRLDTTMSGGAIQYVPSMPAIAGKAYYWRTTQLNGSTPPLWQSQSFTYMPGKGTGFQQGHHYQFLQSQFNQISIDTGSRKFGFDSTLNNLYITHGIYPTSGTEDLHFSVTPNGASTIYSACVGRSIIFNVFDSLNFKPWKNVPGGAYGSGGYCAPGREYNFEFPYFPASNRKLMMDFLDSIPQGHFVVARLVVDPPYDSVDYRIWMRDTTLYGSGKSLYHSLVRQGFAGLDQLTSTRTFIFVFKKNDSLSYKPVWNLSEGLFDRPVLSADLPMPDTTGAVFSPWFGPAKEWKDFKYAGKLVTEPTDTYADSLTIWILGKTPAGKTDTLYKLPKNTLQVSFDTLPGVNATSYPYLQCAIKMSDWANGTPPQPDYWRFGYDPLPEGIPAPNLYYKLNPHPNTGLNSDTIYAYNDSLHLSLAFKNISAAAFSDSVSAAVWLLDSVGKQVQHWQYKLRPIPAGDTAILAFRHNIDTLAPGSYAVKIDFNHNPGAQPEYDGGNNILYQKVLLASKPSYKIFTGSGLWSNPERWLPYGVPACTDKVLIMGHCQVDNSMAVADTLIVEKGFSLGLTAPNAGLRLGCDAGGGNKLLLLRGSMVVDTGIITINGGLHFASGSTFVQNGGLIVLDANQGDTAQSLFVHDTSSVQGGPAGILSIGGSNTSDSSDFYAFSAGRVQATGGKLVVVDPPLAAGRTTLFIHAANDTLVVLGPGHTLVFGDDIYSTAHPSETGFVIVAQDTEKQAKAGSVEITGKGPGNRTVRIAGKTGQVFTATGKWQVNDTAICEIAPGILLLINKSN
jgi:hypothetical protein